MDEMTLKEVVAWQREHDMTDVHVVFLGRTGFHLAHTEPERDDLEMDLESCELHQWLASDDPTTLDIPPQIGLYKVTKREHDPTSESFRSDHCPYDFEILENA